MARERIDYRKIGVDLLIGLGLGATWFVLAALLLWPFGKSILSLHLAKGLCVFVVMAVAALGVSGIVQKLFGIESDPPRDPYVILNIVVSAAVQLGWAAFVTIAVTSLTPGASLLAVALLHVIGLVASWVAGSTLAAFFQGSIYRTTNVIVSVAGYVGFAAFWTWR